MIDDKFGDVLGVDYFWGNKRGDVCEIVLGKSGG